MAPSSDRQTRVGRPTPAHRLGASALVPAVAILLAACSSTTATPTPPAGSTRTTVAPDRSTTTTASPGVDGLAAVRHVFVIVLENEGYATTFGSPSNDPYLAGTLPAAGALLTQDYGVGHHSLDNYVAMVSGQAPNP